MESVARLILVNVLTITLERNVSRLFVWKLVSIVDIVQVQIFALAMNIGLEHYAKFQYVILLVNMVHVLSQMFVFVIITGVGVIVILHCVNNTMDVFMENACLMVIDNIVFVILVGVKKSATVNANMMAVLLILGFI